MLRIRDARTGSLTPVSPGSGVLRVHVNAPGLRPLLVADLLRRTITVFHSWRCFVTAIETAAAADVLNIHPSGVMPQSNHVDLFVGTVAPTQTSIEIGNFVLDPHVDVREPLALRLALLDSAHHEPVELSRAPIAAAEETLKRWRFAVAAWAKSPGAPMPPDYRQRFANALEENLGTAAAFQVLRELEVDESVAAGAKFETFAFADRLLGLDLASEIGR